MSTVVWLNSHENGLQCRYASKVWARQSQSQPRPILLRYLDIGESRHATTNRYKHKPYCTRVPSCTYSTFCDVIRLIIRVLSSRGSIISNRLWAKLTSLLHSVSIWAYLCSSELICVTLSPLGHLGSYLSHLSYLCLSGFLVGNICAYLSFQ